MNIDFRSPHPGLTTCKEIAPEVREARSKHDERGQTTPITVLPTASAAEWRCRPDVFMNTANRSAIVNGGHVPPDD